MEDIIILIQNKCFIDSEGLALLAENEHRAITQLIKSHTNALEEFGGLSFEMSKPDSKGGRPKKVYMLNEQQAILLTTFMKNSKKVVMFKKKLVKEFFKMREYILKQESIRLSGIELRKTLTDKIKESGENERMHGHGYSTYTKLVYKLTDLSFKYKEYSRHNKTGFRDTLKGEDLKRVELAESLIKPLVEMEKQYSEIKETLEPIFKEESKYLL